MVSGTSPQTAPREAAWMQRARRDRGEIIRTIQTFVECESPSDSPVAVDRFVDLLIETARPFAKAKVFRAPGFGKHLLLEFDLGASGRAARVLGLGHSDTVWPLGTLTQMPFRQASGRLWGPGVLDMKAGLAFFVHAVRLMREAEFTPKRRIALWIVSDEEVGSVSSRSLTEKLAQSSESVLVVEPGSGPTGKLKTARKGIAGFRINVKGIAAHAGIDFEQGASAILEAARLIQQLGALTDAGRGVTVNPGVVSGGTRSNVIAGEASIEVDVRVWKKADAARVERKIRALRCADRRCTIAVEGGLNRPPMERTRAVAKLFAEAQEVATTLGVTLEESATGGGSDGNFTAALSIPTLDGLGAVGEGAHAANESILINKIAERTALLAGLLANLAEKP